MVFLCVEVHQNRVELIEANGVILATFCFNAVITVCRIPC